MFRGPCEEHFYEPCVVYRPGEKQCQRIEESHRYEKNTCSKCGWVVATAIKPKVRVETKVTISYSGKVFIPDTLKQKFNAFVDPRNYKFI